MRINVFLLWLLNPLAGLLAALGALLVGWNGIEVYFLVTRRVQPGFEQSPLVVVVPLFIIGLILMFGGWSLHKWLRKNNPF